jgi:hypothetical protein
MHLRNEGIADQIDKPYPIQAMSPSLAWYATAYNKAYAATARRAPQLSGRTDTRTARTWRARSPRPSASTR